MCPLALYSVVLFGYDFHFIYFTGIHPDYNGQIEVDTTEANQYDLTVLDTVAEDSGTYIGTFALYQGSPAPAHLVVVRKLVSRY